MKRNNPILVSVAVALIVGIVTAITLGLNIKEILLIGVLVGAFLIYPIELSVINLIGSFVLPRTEKEQKITHIFEMITIILGLLYTMLFIAISNIRPQAEWTKQLVNDEVHQPIWTGGTPTVIILCVVGLVGYLVLVYVCLEKLPPLAVVLSIAAMYLGIAECVLWMIQTMNMSYWVLSILPMNCVIIGIKTIRCKIAEWNQIQNVVKEQGNGERGMVDGSGCAEKPFMQFINNLLVRAELWPVLAFVLMWPLLGILLGILILLGQKPDALVKAWTETADWRLSQQIAPQNAMYDEHYLCTVAAGGHEKVVKPLRMGERHGHRVVVNRQLCIANAFEQILEEKTPRFHRVVRHVYDTYGFPLSRLIRTKMAADVVYILMKPLEWMFLAVIYLCDVKPENRIAVQYLPRRKIDI